MASRASLIAALNDAPIFLPSDLFWIKVLPNIFTVALSLACLFSFLFGLSEGLFVAEGCSLFTKRKACYQLTNAIANSILGFAGVYFIYFSLPANPPIEEKIQGFENCIFFSSFQIGFQIWAIPLGLLYVHESTPMMVHHFMVIVVSTMSGFLTNGFRHWTPFFYGLVELSSVPLAAMNYFKDNPELIQTYPTLYSAIRSIFAITFVWVRLILFTPQIYTFLRDEYLLVSKSKFIFYQIYMSIVGLSAFGLYVLQVYWGFLVLSAAFKQIFGKTKKKSSRVSGMKAGNKKS